MSVELGEDKVNENRLESKFVPINELSCGDVFVLENGQKGLCQSVVGHELACTILSPDGKGVLRDRDAVLIIKDIQEKAELLGHVDLINRKGKEKLSELMMGFREAGKKALDEFPSDSETYKIISLYCVNIGLGHPDHPSYSQTYSHILHSTYKDLVDSPDGCPANFKMTMELAEKIKLAQEEMNRSENEQLIKIAYKGN